MKLRQKLSKNYENKIRRKHQVKIDSNWRFNKKKIKDGYTKVYFKEYRDKWSFWKISKLKDQKHHSIHKQTYIKQARTIFYFTFCNSLQVTLIIYTN